MTSQDKRLILVIGGSGSGKSELAEQLAIELHGLSGHLYYVATMVSMDAESDNRILKHVKRREGTLFETVEKPVNVGGINAENDDVILLECMSNLLANEMFQDNDIDKECVTRIVNDIKKLHDTCDMVIVSNEVSLDGCDYDDVTREYIADISYINRQLAELADTVIEVVAGIPVYIKGGGAEQ